MQDIMNFDKKNKEFDGIFTQAFDQVLGEHDVDDSIPTNLVVTTDRETRIPVCFLFLLGHAELTVIGNCSLALSRLVGSPTGSTYWDFLYCYCPSLSRICTHSPSPNFIAEVDIDVFGLSYNGPPLNHF